MKAAFLYLKKRQSSHSKVREIIYNKLETQRYMTSPLFSNAEVSLLFSLRSKYLDCKMNFKNRYNNDDLLCNFCKEEQDDQQHILQCKTLNSKLSSEELAQGLVKYEDIYGDHLKQKVIVTIFSELLDIRKTMAEDS